ncbi:phage tail assembly chaperone [Sphingomonas sp.]|uniref:phage tail assembly chaperone n=1 Tax=Sphingomonas sp. TaxID=28214 RepID=UPI0035C79144
MASRTTRPPPTPSPSLPGRGDFGAAAARLAGLAGVAFGWSPDAFWRATPAELGALVRAIAGEDVAPPDAAAIARLKEAFPDG